MASIENNSVRVFAPATVANVGCGFDVLGFAIYGLGDFVTAKKSAEPGVRISSITGDRGMLTLESEKNTAGLAVLSLLNFLDDQKTGIELSIEKKMPLGSGLGSSAASSVAAVKAVNSLLGDRFTTGELLRFAMDGEVAASGSAHADNVAASLFGGFILVRTHQPPDVIKLPTPAKLCCTIIHPKIEIQTRYSRQILKKDVPLAKAVTQWANMGALVSALYTNNYDLIGRSLHDEIIEPVRSVLIPGFGEMKKAALKSGALACTISGSGPSLFALSTSEDQAERIGKSMGKVLAGIDLEYDIHISRINTEGASVVEEKK